MKKIVFVLMLAALFVLSGCGGEAPAEAAAPAAAVLDMQQLYDDLTAQDTVPEMLPLDADMQLNFCGIQAADCAHSVVAISVDGMLADEIWLVEAVDAAALERIQTAAQNRLTAKAEESITYSPEQHAIIQKAQTFTIGNYYVMLVSPDVQTLADIVTSAAGI